MTDQTTAHPAEAAEPLPRRFLLRGGAVLAGAAGVTALGAAVNPTAASAADGDNLLVGRANSSASSTTLKIANGASPALVLDNDSGPSLRLDPFDGVYTGTLAPGDLIGTSSGPQVAINFGSGPEFDFLVTGRDLDLIPTVAAQTPERVLDTRSEQGRASILRLSTTTALDSSNRLKAGQWLDVEIGPANAEFELGGVFINLAAALPVDTGYLTAYPPGTRPNASTLNFRGGVSIANGTLAALGVVGTSYVLRIFTSTTTHVILDLNGVIISAPSSNTAPKNGARALRTERQAKRASQLRQALRR